MHRENLMPESGLVLGREMIATSSPIRRLLQQADEIGAVYRLDGFREALIVTNDLFVADAYGVPQHAFLLACLRDLTEIETAGSIPEEDREVILLRVCDTRALPDDGDMERLRARLGRDLVTENRRTDENRRTPDQLIDALTESEIQTFGLSCAVLGTFYDEENGTLAFGSDMDNIYAARRLLVYKPYGESLKRIVSFLQLMTDEPPMTMPLGTLRYASTRRRERIAAKASTPKPTDVDVEVNIADFVAHKTAVFGMTRLGKSNTMKVIATAVFRYGKTTGVKIGQLIFDPASEYASENPQDGTALAKLGAEHVRRYRFGATQAELDEDPGLRPLALNFFNEDEIGPVRDLVGSFALAATNSAQYATAFAYADLVGPAELVDGDDRKQRQYARRARLMFYATLIKAGLEPPQRWTYWAPTNGDLRATLAGMQGPRGEDLSFISALHVGKDGSIPLDAKQVLTVAEAIAAEGLKDNPNEDVANWFNVPDERVKHVANVLLTVSGGGIKILKPLGEGYHSPAARDDYAPQIYRDLVAGRIVIVDLSRGSEGVLQFASERIINYVLGRAAEKFRSGQEADVIQIFLEEAHRLFDRERFRDAKHTADPYVRLAREAAKYKIGMIYSTQQVSSVETDVLDNTANWIIAHLNSESEVKLLRGRYEFGRFAEQILTAEDRGFVRLKTLSSRFVVPVQVRKFDGAMIDEARAAVAEAAAGSNGGSAAASVGPPAEE